MPETGPRKKDTRNKPTDGPENPQTTVIKIRFKQKLGLICSRKQNQNGKFQQQTGIGKKESMEILVLINMITGLKS